MSTTTQRALQTSVTRRARSVHTTATLLGLLAAALGAAFIPVPSIWYDEAATVVSATRSWAALWQMVQQVDAVHAAYYAAMHLWFDLVGYSPFSLRAPSAIAGGLGVALAVELVDRLAHRRLAIITGIVLMLIPRYTWAMSEGRSYALSSTLAILTTLPLVTAVDTRPRSITRQRMAWTLYAVGCVVAIACFAYLALLVVAHAVTVLLWARRRRASLPAFGFAPGAAALIVLPLLLAIAGQSGQVSWIEATGWQSFGSFFITQYSPANPAFALVAWVAAAGGLVLAFRTRPLERVRTVFWPVLVLPAAALIAVSFVKPLYSPRYLSFTAVAFAFFIAVAVDALATRRRGSLTAGVAMLAALSAPSYISQRLPEAKQSSSWAAVASLVAQHSPAPGTETAIVYDRVAGHPTTTARIIADSYPTAFVGLHDIALTIPYADASTLWGAQTAVQESMLTGMDASWLIASDRSNASAAISTIESAGLEPVQHWHLSNVDVYYFAR
ncbi:glycosyltransferase family 39 protein [Microbacteriaceae bacterium VKM Ac-2854]|nr:glycosyltransferase family 39 protein [Microbacteriaceae bacterium VKM Ac-2854]